MAFKDIKKNKPLILVILDGWGINKNKKGNAIIGGDTKFIDFLRLNYPTSKLIASGEGVGLPKGFQGNSEVGHINLGAGRVVYQMLKIINRKIKNHSFFEDEELIQAIENCKKHDSTLHLMGLLSDQGVHSHQNHLFALMLMAKMHKIKKVKIHIFTDGRDTLPKSASKYFIELEKRIKKYNIGEIVTVCGRYYAMDRDNRWNRTKKAYDTIAEGKGKELTTWRELVKKSYLKGTSDEFFIPSSKKSYKGIEKNDSIVFFNYRLDRARQLTHALTDLLFKNFKRKKKKIFFVAFAPYYKNILGKIAFHEPWLPNVLGGVLAKHRLKQFRIAETEKYAHVTYFFNGEREKPFKNETRYIIPSPKVATYDSTPEMSAYKITKKILEVIPKYDVIIVNYANADMVGHTGNFKAAKEAVHHIDKCVEKLYDAIKKIDGTMLIAADHGNCEEMINKDGKPMTSHTLNEIPFTLIGTQVNVKDGKLADVAPTILDLLNIKKPKQMTGKSLIIKSSSN